MKINFENTMQCYKHVYTKIKTMLTAIKQPLYPNV